MLSFMALTKQSMNKIFLGFIVMVLCMQHSLDSFTLSKKSKVIVLLGAPGSGKGTHATHLSQEYHLPHVATGDLLREHIAQGSAIGQEAKTYIDQGLLVPDATVFDMLQQRLQQADCHKGCILDGFPRTLHQAYQLQSLIKHSQVCVLSLEVPDQVIVERISHRLICDTCSAPYHTLHYPPQQEGACDLCPGHLIARSDDTVDTVLKRLTVFHEQTDPVKQYYHDQGLLIFIDGNQSKEKTYQEIEVSLEIAMR